MPSAYRDDEPASLHEIPPISDEENQTGFESQDDTLHIGSVSDASEERLPVPVWLQESAKTFKYRAVPLPIRKAARAVAKFVKGPIPPRELRVNPIFPKVQEAPIRLLDRYVPKRRHRASLLVVLIATWFLIWSLMLKKLSTAGFIEGYGKPQNLWCGATFWQPENGCGLNGDGCRPFSATSLAFKCPANCEILHLREKHWVGNHSYEYRPLVIGGPPVDDDDGKAIYRGDSWICQAAMHAGVATDSTGGCGVATLVGEHTNFSSSKRHGIESIGFPSSFPLSFSFLDPSTINAQCPPDSRWGIFAVTAVALVLLSLFTTSPAAFFFGTFFILMFHVGLVSDPPNAPNFYELLSTLMGRLLPASFVSLILYRFCAIPLLTGMTAQIEKTVLYLGFCFLGALNNYTFAPLIPIERLTPHDLAEPGAKFALGLIITIILLIVFTQMHFIRISGNMPRYLVVYGVMGSALIILLALPGQRLRIHHYILGILFMPGTFTKNRLAMACQGLLLGFFINGTARWGFDSIIQTPAALGEGSGGHDRSWWGSASPNVTAYVPPNGANITFNWGQLPPDTGIDGVSILINDVERWRGYVDSELYRNETKITLKRQRQFRDNPAPEFFRFAWLNSGSTGRYSKPGVWDVDDIWHPIPPR